MTEGPDPRAAEPLPPLSDRLRGGVAGIRKAGLALAEEVFTLGFLSAALGAEEQAALSRLCRPEDRDRDEAYAELLRLPGVAEGTGLPAELLEESFLQELALAQMEQGGGRLALGLADGIRLERAALYGTNGQNEGCLAALLAGGDLDEGQKLSLSTGFAEAQRQDGLLRERAEDARRLSEGLAAELKTQVAQLSAGAESRADLDALLLAARDPARPFPLSLSRTED